jgi:flagellar biosynthesis/type III secretory pathway M-ring protein FliF/YscJ
MSSTGVTQNTAGKLPVYTIVTIAVTGVLALFSLFFILVVVLKSRNLDKEEDADKHEEPRKTPTPTTAIIDVQEKASDDAPSKSDDKKPDNDE